MSRKSMFSAASFAFFGVALAFAQNAAAMQITCASASPDLVLSYDTRSLAVSLASSVAALPLAPTAQFEAGSTPSTLNIVDDTHTTIATLAVRGHALSADVSWITSTGEPVGCALQGDAEDLFDHLITDASTLSAMAKWKAWVAARPPACDEFLDSIGYFQPSAGQKIALVLHGYSSNPRRMQAVIRILLDAGYNVIAPRLAHHFDRDLKDLDTATAAEWEQDAVQTFAIAKAFGPQVTLVGYSLGGALASRLALAQPDSIDKMLLLAPAWRITQSVNWGSMIGSAFSISYNDFMKIPPACTMQAGYTSSQAGVQVRKVGFDTDLKYEKQIEPVPREYERMKVPHLIFTTPGDSVISSSVVDPICRVNFLYCTHVNVPNREHTTIELDMTVKASGDFALRTMSEIATAFLNMAAPPAGAPQTLDPSLVH